MAHLMCGQRLTTRSLLKEHYRAREVSVPVEVCVGVVTHRARGASLPAGFVVGVVQLITQCSYVVSSSK